MSISLNCSIKSNTSGTFSDTECKFYTAYCVWFKAGSCNFKYSHRIYTKHPDNKNLDISLKKSLFNYFLLFFFFMKSQASALHCASYGVGHTLLVQSSFCVVTEDSSSLEEDFKLISKQQGCGCTVHHCQTLHSSYVTRNSNECFQQENRLPSPISLNVDSEQTPHNEPALISDLMK